MILEVFIVFIAICFILIFIGFYTQIRVVSLIAFMGLMLLGLVLQAGSVTAQKGYTVNKTYILNNTVLTSEATTFDYDSVNDTTTTWLGRWLAFAGALGFILTIVSNEGKGAR